MTGARVLLLAGVLATLTGAPGQRRTGGIMTTAAPELPVAGTMPPLDGATGWLNSAPLTAEGLRGKVVLIDFWTYSCINWLRTLPYVRAWEAKYRAQGLVVLGVHSPEFSFEHEVENVRRAALEMGVGYPVALDNDFTIWRAFDNNAWPALYLVDAGGRIRYRHFGEGDYEGTERAIQQLLREAGSGGNEAGLVAVEGRGAEAAADWSTLRSGENYLGYRRSENFASSGGAVLSRRHVYLAPAELGLNHWALAGDWTMGPESTGLNLARGRMVYRFHARDLHLVMGSALKRAVVRFRLRIDGAPPGAAHGLDADAEGNGTVGEPRMYQLIRQSGTILDRLFEIEFLDPGAELFSITFG